MKSVSLIIALLFIAVKVQSQGSSDAGLSMVGNMRPSGNNDSMKNGLGFSFSYGIGERGTIILTPQFEPQIKISDKSMVQIKIPMVQINGDLGKINGMGDVILSYSRLLDSVWKYPILITIGTRIATGSSSLKSDNISLPMPYQLSLGTTDIILGAKIKLKKGLSIAVGFQNPLFNRNQNGFDSAAYNLVKTKQIKEENNYFISSYLRRKGDIMIRIDKTFNYKKTMTSIGIVPIYHLGNDKARIDKATTVEMKNSKGLTLNVNVGFMYKLSPKLELSAIAAAPIIMRNSRPDGLTRSFLFIPGLKYDF